MGTRCLIPGAATARVANHWQSNIINNRSSLAITCLILSELHPQIGCLISELISGNSWELVVFKFSPETEVVEDVGAMPVRTRSLGKISQVWFRFLDCKGSIEGERLWFQGVGLILAWRTRKINLVYVNHLRLQFFFAPLARIIQKAIHCIEYVLLLVVILLLFVGVIFPVL